MWLCFITHSGATFEFWFRCGIEISCHINRKSTFLVGHKCWHSGMFKQSLFLKNALFFLKIEKHSKSYLYSRSKTPLRTCKTTGCLRNEAYPCEECNFQSDNLMAMTLLFVVWPMIFSTFQHHDLFFFSKERIERRGFLKSWMHILSVLKKNSAWDCTLW